MSSTVFLTSPSAAGLPRPFEGTSIPVKALNATPPTRGPAPGLAWRSTAQRSLHVASARKSRQPRHPASKRYDRRGHAGELHVVPFQQPTGLADGLGLESAPGSLWIPKPPVAGLGSVDPWVPRTTPHAGAVSAFARRSLRGSEGGSVGTSSGAITSTGTSGGSSASSLCWKYPLIR